MGDQDSSEKKPTEAAKQEDAQDISTRIHDLREKVERLSGTFDSVESELKEASSNPAT